MFGLETFELAKEWLPKLLGKLVEIRAARKSEIDELADIFGDPLHLARYYIEPSCQQLNPADFEEDESIVREPIFERLEAFLSGDPERKNKHLFILSDAGMGKTSATCNAQVVASDFILAAKAAL